jgi:hypothetical protein
LLVGFGGLAQNNARMNSGGTYSRRELPIARAAFCSGAGGILRVLARLANRADYDELHSVIEAHDRLIEKLLKKYMPPATRH